MQLGLIGLGKMGGNMAERIRRAGHEVVGYDHHSEKRNGLLRIGFLLSPPLIGLIADATSLRVALLTVVLAGLGTLLVGRVLPRTAAAP